MTAAAQQNLKTVTSPPKSRMSLAAVVKGKLEHPLKVILYGVEGIGKSTFGAGAPNPIFLGAEEGTQHLDVARFPKPEQLQDVHDAIRELTESTHDFQSLVVDTLDWLEPLIWQHVCARAGVASIEEVGSGYGRGYVAALDEWRRILKGLERLQALKRMHIALLAHSQIRSFKNPEGPDFDRYEMKINAKAAGVVKEWSDAVLFAKYETFANVDGRTKRVRGVDTGQRLIYTQQRAAWDAKNRYSLPESLPLSWTDFLAAVKSGQVAPTATLVEEIQRKAAELGPDIEAKTADWLKGHATNANDLAQMNNRLNVKLAEKAASQTTAADTAEKVN
jgi:hypothetical protein